MRLRQVIAANLGLAALVAAGPTVAGTFTLSPLRVDFAQATSTVALTVRNEETAPVVVQTQALAWSQEGGQDALKPSRDLLISPAVFTLPPGGQQLVRVALRRTVDPTRELCYRVTLQEVPQPASPDFTGLQVALRLSVPVFVAPLSAAEPNVTWSASRTPDSRLAVSARNDGAAHARVHSFVLKTADGAVTVAEQSSLGYVLPGTHRDWVFDDNNDNTRTNATSTAAPERAGGRYRLEGITDRGAFATELLLHGN